MFGWLSTVKYSDKYDRIISFRNYILILISQHYFVILIKRKPYENIFLCLTLIWFLNKKKTRYVDYQHWLCDVKQVTWSTQMVSLKQSFSNTVLGTPEQSYNNNDEYQVPEIKPGYWTFEVLCINRIFRHGFSSFFAKKYFGIFDDFSKYRTYVKEAAKLWKSHRILQKRKRKRKPMFKLNFNQFFD